MVACKKFLGVRLPYSMQTAERQNKERQIAKRAIRMAVEKADYCENICAYATLDLMSLRAGTNPRAIIRGLSGQVRESLEYPDYRQRRGFLPGGANLDAMEARSLGHPLYASRDVRKENFEAQLAVA